MSQTLEVLNNRIDQFGLTEPSIRRQGADQIIVEIPGTSDPETVRRFIMGKGLLTFHIADTDALAEVQGVRAADAHGAPRRGRQRPRPEGARASCRRATILRGVFQKDAYGLDELKGYTVLHEEVGLNGT